MKRLLLLLALSAAAHAETYRLTDTQQLTSTSYAMNPTVLTTGEVCYSEWDGFGMRAVSHTPSNQWWVRCMNGDGTNNRVVLGAHGSSTFKTRDYLAGIVDPARSGEGSTQFKLLRPVTEIKRGKYAVTSYYRSNHQGAMGMIFGFTLSSAEGYSQSSKLDASDYKSTVEGSGRFVPNVEVLTPFSNDQDISNYGTKFRLPLKPGEPEKAMGRAGMAAASVDGEYIYTHCRGSCYEGTMPEFNTRVAMGGEPTSKFEIRKALVPQITDPFNEKQSVTIACAEEKYNCRDARYVVPYQRLFGVPVPATAEPLVTSKVTTLQIVNARAGEIYPISTNPQDKISFQGNAVDGWQAKIAAIRIDEITQWTTKPTRYGFAATAKFGTFYLEKDGSVKIALKCPMVYQLRGVDAAGNVVAEDNSLHQAVCGETVTCHGCHDGHSVERAALYKPAVERFKATIAASKPPAPGC